MKLPKILKTSLVAQSQLFSIETMDLRFSNGEQRTYERLPRRLGKGVIVCAINEQKEIILVREYMAGLHKYELALPKGRVNVDEILCDAANRELQEETGFAANSLTYLKELSVAPGQMGFTIHAYLATELYENQLPGDEPEPLEKVFWKIDDVDRLFQRNDFSEARSMATISLAIHAYHEQHREIEASVED